MASSYRCLALLLALVSAMSLLACAQEGADRQRDTKISQPGLQGKKGEIQWLDFNHGLARARADNKSIMIDFYTDWCVYCKKLDRETLQNQEVTRILTENFIAIRLNAEKSEGDILYRGKAYSPAGLSRYFGVTAFPSLAFLDSGGQPITLLPGFVPAPQFSAILNYIQQKCYLTHISFDEFIRKGDCN